MPDPIMEGDPGSALGAGEAFELQRETEPARSDEEPPAPRLVVDRRPSRGSTLTLPIDDAGHVAWEATGNKKRDRLRQVAADPKFHQLIAPVVAGASSAPASMFADGSFADLAFQMISGVVVAQIEGRGVPREIAALIAMTPEQRQQMAPLTNKLLDKYLGKYQLSDEAMWISGMGLIAFQNYQRMLGALRELQAAREHTAGGGGQPS